MTAASRSRKLIVVCIMLILIAAFAARIWSDFGSSAAGPKYDTDDAKYSRNEEEERLSHLLSLTGFEETGTAGSAPLFELASLDGKNVRLDQLKGKVVLLGFWTTW